MSDSDSIIPFLLTVHRVWFYLVFICVLRSCDGFVFLMLITNVCKIVECETWKC